MRPVLRLALRLALLTECFAFSVSAGALAPESARFQGALDAGEPRLEAELLVDPEPLDEAGSGWRVGVWLAPDPGWHIYGEDPGETGLPTLIRFEAAGARSGPIGWPEPRRFLEGEDALDTRGYDAPVLLASELRLAEGGSAPLLRAHVETLVCADQCIPARFVLERPLAADADAQRVRALFAAHAVPPPDPRAEAGGGGDVPPPARGARPAARGLLAALALAFLGGLILNAMPCVLPVLALKLFAVAELRGTARSELRRHAAAYAGGVTLAMSGLAAAVIGLRAAGTAVGWGFQFQEPLYLAALACVLVLFALNLMGVYEVQAQPAGLATLGAEASGSRRSFFEGLLAVFLATPCSAPFLGTAVGFAFASPAGAIVAVFLAVGAGLAAPYLLVSLVPACAALVPRPGAWMLGLRAVLGFLLLGTTLWLLFVLERVAGGPTVLALLVLLWALSLAAWIYGRLQAGDAPWLRRALPLVALAVLAVGLDRVALVPAPGARPTAEGFRDERPFDPEAIERTLAGGAPVFVYFTADWCLTCKANERVTLRDDSVREALQAGGFAVFRADWTRRDETIRAELARHGRAGVPLYVVRFPPPADSPIVLPELLTPELLIAALDPPAAAHALR